MHRAIGGATAYITMEPCRTCAMLLITCGIEKIVVRKKYPSSEYDVECMIRQAGVKFKILTDKKEIY
jgi:dCMP deaminase